jgi:hypothetical protein
MFHVEQLDVSVMLGQTLQEIKKVDNDQLLFTTVDGVVYRMFHSQCCCEDVSIEDVTGDLNDLVGSPLTMSEEVADYDGPIPESYDSYTWTFYKFATLKGYVTVRWYGESNGYYSESVDFEKLS